MSPAFTMKRAYSIAILVFVAGSVLAATNAPVLKLKDHPRLWVKKDTVLNLSKKLHTPYMKEQARRILEDADWLIEAKPIAEGEARSFQQGTRTIASHLQTLTSAWVLTHEAKYRAAAMRHLGNMMNWNQISCEARPNMSYEQNMFFCLSYGEHCADIGLMYDLFRPDITPEEKKVFDDVLDRFYLKEALRAVSHPPWWANKRWTNWNGVCAGGMGIMALAFYDDRPECRVLIPFVEKSLGEYFKSYIDNGGGCHEGTGYWNYGMHYALRYVLSWENATGKKHPALEIPELRKTLDFPLDFHRLTFGDNDGWHPTGIFFLMAERLGNKNAALRAATYLPERFTKPRPTERNRLSRTAFGDILFAGDAIPSPEVMAEFRKKHEEKKEPLARVYEGLGWGVLADDSAFPTLRMTVRGGSSKIQGHGHIDLLSFKCMVNGQRMIEDQPDRNCVAFTERGHDLWGRSPASKSTIFVDGLGCGLNMTCSATEVVKGDGLLGIRIDGSRIFIPRWRGFIGRLFLMVDNKYWLVISSARGHGLESRFITFAEFTSGPDWVLLKRGEEQMMMTFAGTGNGVLQESLGMPASARKQSQIFRWMSGDGSLQVAALNPGTEKLGLKVRRDGRDYAIDVTGPEGYKRAMHLSSKLELLASE